MNKVEFTKFFIQEVLPYLHPSPEKEKELLEAIQKLPEDHPFNIVVDRLKQKVEQIKRREFIVKKLTERQHI